jgi:hypothetical protein
MSYTINKTDGTKVVVLKEGTVDITTTDLALFGKGYAGFGERLNENFVKLLENFANTTAPAHKIRGQLWYDTLTNQIKVWNGNTFKPVGSSNNSENEPTDANLGDTWFDTNNFQLYVYNGTDWTLIGPTTVAGSGITAVIGDSIRNDAGVFKAVLKFVTNDQIVAMVSPEEFVPQTAITGFATIYKGITLSTAISQSRFAGTATRATKLVFPDGVTELAADNILRSDTNDSTSGTLTIFNDGGLSLGSGADLTISITGGDNVVLQNNTLNGDIIFKVNDGGVTTTVMTVDGATSRLGIGTSSPSTALDVTGTITATAFAGTLTGTVNSNTINVLTSGSIVFEGSSDDAYETTLTVDNPTADRTITLPNVTGTVITTGDTGTVTSTMIADGTIVNGDIANTTIRAAKLDLSSDSVTASTLSDSKGEIRSVPQIVKSTSYNFISSDHGKHVSTDSGVTLNTGIFTVGQNVTVFNSSSSSITITQGAGVTIYQAGTANTGSRTLAQKGIATLFCVGTNQYVITGGGLS